MNIYALYDGEYIVAEGSVREIAMQTGIPENTVRWYGTQPARDRNINKALVKIEEDDEMFIGSNQPRSKRSHSVYAPTLTNDVNERTEDVEITYRRIELKLFKFESRYINSMLDEMFKNWKE